VKEIKIKMLVYNIELIPKLKITSFNLYFEMNNRTTDKGSSYETPVETEVKMGFGIGS
jgi:hypothetical protein